MVDLFEHPTTVHFALLVACGLLPKTIEGLDSSLVNMMTGVMSVEKINIQDILKGLCDINKKYKFYLDTKVDETFIRQVTEIGYSRIPILHSEAYPFFVGVLIV